MRQGASRSQIAAARRREFSLQNNWLDPAGGVRQNTRACNLNL
jgi:hypothetical protein